MRSEFSDLELLEAMADREENPERAERARNELWTKVHPFLLGISRRKRLARDEAGHNDLVNDTILRAYRYARTFDLERVVTMDGIKAWLCGILHCVFLDRVRKRNREWPGDDMSRIALREGSTYRESPWTAAVGEALRELPPLYRDALRLAMLWYNPEKQHSRLPRGVLEEIANILGVSKARVRTIITNGKRHIERRMLQTLAQRSQERTSEKLDEYRRD